ncbi:MAG: TlpA disulfide reductase family protein [Thermoproteota archaeon]|nr:TlpA disulfide reductase family protein [Thermoproteota archaeon]
MKKKQRNLIIALVIIAFIAGIIVLNLQGFSGTSSSSKAIDFELPIIDANGLTGSSAKLSDYKGKVILLEFAVEWCPHCRNMVSVIKQINQDFQSKGVVVITVMLSANTDVARTALFIRTYNTNWLHVYDINGEVMNKYGVTATPTYFIIDKNFNIVDRFQGENSYDYIASKLLKYLS